MRAFNNGSLFSVTVASDEITDFARHWPCCELPFGPITFQFEKNNGDLVAITGHADYDGPDLLALSEDAEEYGRGRMRERGLL